MVRVNEQQRANALIALAACGPTQLEGQRPSDEDLAAFIDNRVSKADRQRIKSFIARDGATYQRWIQALDSHRLMSESSVLHSPNDQTQGETGNPLRSFARKCFTLPWFSPLIGSSIVTALLVIMLLPTNHRLDGYYTDFPLHLSTKDSDIFTPKSLPFAAAKPKLIQAIEYGIYKRLPESMKSNQHDSIRLTKQRPEADETTSDKEIDIAQHAGALALLNHHYCQNAAAATRTDYINATYGYTLELMGQMRSSNIDKKLSLQLETGENRSDVVCRFAQELLGAI